MKGEKVKEITNTAAILEIGKIAQMTDDNSL